MQKKLKIAVMALFIATTALAQTDEPKQSADQESVSSEQAFTFTEAQLGDDDDMSQNVTIISSNQNVYASQVGYTWSPVRFRYRAFNQKYNEIYINGVQMNDMESGQFRYSLVGGLNQQTRGVENALPFEFNNFAVAGMGGSNNYNFRPSAMATGQRVTLTGANRNYTVRAMYTYNSGLRPDGWAFSANVTYRWANMATANVPGTFYNSLSYFLGAEKKLNDKHAISFVTWGNPTERAAQGPATDEMYWIANSYFYNPNWGYQDGKKRSARVINDFAPTAMLTRDWNIGQDTKLITSLTGRYSIYKSTNLEYNDSENPKPNYWKNLPSSYYDVWYPEDVAGRTMSGYQDFWRAWAYLSGSEENRQINWDRLYLANVQGNATGRDASYFVSARYNNNINLSLASTLNTKLGTNTALNLGLQLAANIGQHYKKIDDMLGANSLRNINTYALGTYSIGDPHVYYDLRNKDAILKEGDKYGYDYNLHVRKAQLWGSLKWNRDNYQSFLAGRIGGVTMQRDGKMRNGLAPNNSYGKSGTARFLDGGGKAGAHINLGKGNVLMLGIGYELKTPTPKTSFSAPRVNNDFVKDLKQEKLFSAEVGYQLQTPWLKANLNAYYNHLYDVTEQTMYYSDYDNSFAYASLTGIEKEYYGVELGLNFKLTDWLNLKALGVVSEAMYVNNADMRLMLSNSGDYVDEKCINNGMREGNTPLTAGSLDFSFHSRGWYFDLIGNYYDRIYLYYSPDSKRQTNAVVNDDGEYQKMTQAEGKGGFMLDASISRSIRLKHGRILGFNLMMTNLLNNMNICTGGYEKSRQDLKLNNEGVLQGRTNNAYVFGRNPIKYYAQGINGMFMVTYRF